MGYFGGMEMIVYPNPAIPDGIEKVSGDLNIRDYFAAKAMQSLILEDLSKLQEKHDLKRSEIVSTLAYKYADSMMEKRK